VGFLEPLRDIYFLRALLQTLAALNALVGALVRRDTEGGVIHKLTCLHIVVHDGVVIDLKDTGDLHVVRAGLTIAAVGTGDGTQALISRLDSSDDLEVSGGKEAGAGLAGDFNVFHDLRKSAHAG
jgi:hypothetical protein